MSYVIYNKQTTVTVLTPSGGVGCYKEFYKSESAAKAALTRIYNSGKLGDYGTAKKEDFAVAETIEFRANIEKMVTRKNAMTGKEFQEPINTPYNTSPASENYWTS